MDDEETVKMKDKMDEYVENLASYHGLLALYPNVVKYCVATRTRTVSEIQRLTVIQLFCNSIH